ncbi:leucyl-tRNA synthetase [Buchnera aphidicola (Cinara tujafilina)]|uniref:Leucine--tRNA ligase n=1 Tax=Buchnera aphidicola (Cinara tujafilina) TaxID=261317 RepID=F7WZJ6_9GAMM|nr:leucine--tRNA ligase [Buchnera aphidicola]AEH39863.1 leucyl-tRNA synthetase [Buchnera aphidicola (Cinara tujafilina)]
MNLEYNPKKIESFVQQYWRNNNTFSVSENSTKKKYFCVPMLPYPSGNLHMGHVRNYTISDVIARYQRMLGKNVLQPIGWDAFGLPAEETAIKNNISPSEWTLLNIKTMKHQLQSLGFSYDWKRELNTCNPYYYKWEQWFFIQLYKKKLVYKKNTLVNWCPHDKTVLANEQVHHGKCWRCNTNVILKKIPQWFMKITNYAEELLQDLKKLKNGLKKVLRMQKNWIGKSTGLLIKCKIYHSKKKIKIYTTKPKNIMHITFFAISMYHSIVPLLCKKNKEIHNFLNTYNNINISKMYKKNKYLGINTNHFIIHPVTNKKIPLWIALYIKHDYATGAIMGTPEYDKNDFHFASFHSLPINIKNLTYKNIDINEKNNSILNVHKENKDLLTSNDFNNTKILSNIIKILIKKKKAKKYICYKLKDWSISRQRYWGAPIPIVYTKKGKIIPVPEKNLPVILPDYSSVKNYTQPLQFQKSWLYTVINKENVIRETDTFDTFIESSWYYARYTCPNFTSGMIAPEKAKYWLPVDQYIGGIEHAVMHLIYFRFYHKLLRDFGLVSSDEPVKKLICQGMVLSDAFYTYDHNKKKIWIKPSDIKNHKKYSDKKNKNKIIYAGKIKMSKSKNNGIDPHIIINKYGADTLRLFLMFAAPIESALEWNDQSIIGMYRFLKKLWTFTYSLSLYLIKIPLNIHEQHDHHDIFIILNNTISYVTDDIKRRHSFNTAIAHIIKLFNIILKLPCQTDKNKIIIKQSLAIILKMLYPFTPHICFILWKEIYGKDADIDQESWPITYEIKKNIISHPFIIQINGKKKNIINISNIYSKKEKIEFALKNKKIKKYLKNKNIKNTIYIHQKLINFVI